MHEDEYIGRHLLLSSLEYRYLFPFRLAFDFYFSLRYDLGATWKNATDMRPRDIQQGIGAAISMNIYLGPFTIAFGRNSEGRNRFYFSAGYEF